MGRDGTLYGANNMGCFSLEVAGLPKKYVARENITVRNQGKGDRIAITLICNVITD
ncbi:hypothetical protein ETA_32670 [Erwinia tasmaniensis Et1/99]|uniref:Uncharacterized protein n=1 Tax=Erwinia tasmaniensis (strain DSM 17950 / CFBP 7177 / CIP 109463 / NCPPB 4357 / Et1/99) TaxID=465817 RepID=B2VJQ6_ERWT9|nr:hypothetical protein ETA_32670 [Erwinia tasmaniensis Et1/99]